MVKKIIIFMRILFEENEQKRYLNEVCKEMGVSLRKLSIDLNEDLGMTYSSMKKYYNESLLLPSKVAILLTKKSSINLKEFGIKGIVPDNWGCVKGGKIGYKNMTKKYSHKLNLWRKRGGKTTGVKYPRNLADRTIKEVKIPKMNEKLAEFIGICLGDGTLTKYFMRISFDPRYEMSYLDYISNLCLNLFEIKTTSRKEKGRNLIYIELRSVKICKFLHETCGLPYGDKIKNKSKIPEVIVKNINLSCSCLRGLVDTDGSIRNYVNFWSNNPIIIKQVEELNQKLKIFTTSNEKFVSTGVWNNVIRYFKIVGSSNLKHIVRFHKKFISGQKVYVKDAPKFYKEYKNIKLPFKLGADGPVG